jgi:hypothetical protein
MLDLVVFAVYFRHRNTILQNFSAKIFVNDVSLPVWTNEIVLYQSLIFSYQKLAATCCQRISTVYDGLFLNGVLRPELNINITDKFPCLQTLSC